MERTEVARIRNELHAAGAGWYGLLTPEVKTVIKNLRESEHIGGVIYGRYSTGMGWLVATTQRILFIDTKPFFSKFDEVTYDVVSGVKDSNMGLFSSVVLHTKVKDYSLHFVSPRCAAIFVKFIEGKRLEGITGKPAEPVSSKVVVSKPLPAFQNISDDAMNFLRSHGTAVLSTVNDGAQPHGAVVYYLIDQNNFIYILTKSSTDKARNVLSGGQVALTAYEPGTMQTVQLQGIAEIEADQAVKERVFSLMVKPRPYRSGMEMPPVSKLHTGAYIVIKIKPTTIIFHDYAKDE